MPIDFVAEVKEIVVRKKRTMKGRDQKMEGRRSDRMVRRGGGRHGEGINEDLSAEA